MPRPSPFRRVCVVATAFAALVMLEGRATANSAAPFSRPTGAVPGVVIERPSPVSVEREELDIDCTRESSPIHETCDFTATYFLHNPAANEEELLGAFYTVARKRKHRPSSDDPAPTVSALLDGKDVHAETTDEQAARMDAIVRDDPEIATLASAYRVLELVRAPFRIVVASGQRARLVFHGRLDPTKFSDHHWAENYVIPAILARHLSLASRHALAWNESSEDYLYLISPISRWAGDPEIRVRIRHHAASDLTPFSPRAGWTSTREGSVTTESTVLRASSRQNLHFRMSYSPSVFHNGGPLVGIGPRIGRHELRLRFGYEVGLSSFAILAASAETNFQNYVTTAVTADVASPLLMFIIPSLSLGAGVPVQFRREEPSRVGVRGQIGISWPYVSLLLPIDFYPMPNSSGSRVEGAFVTQVSF